MADQEPSKRRRNSGSDASNASSDSEDAKKDKMRATKERLIDMIKDRLGDSPVAGRGPSPGAEGNGEADAANPEAGAKKQEPDPLVDEGWTDVLDSRQLYRRVVREGKGGERPFYGQVVTIRARAWLEDPPGPGGKQDWGQWEEGGGWNDETVVERFDSTTFLVNHSEVVKAWDMCVQMMTVGEVDLIRADPRFAYGKAGKKPGIPPNATIVFELELLTVEEGPEVEKMSAGERLEMGNRKKDRGNYYYSREEFVEAVGVYERTCTILDPEAAKCESETERKELIAAFVNVANNLAAAQLRMEAWDAALESLKKSYRYDPGNVKSMYRKGKALQGKGDLRSALDVFRDALQLDPNSGAIKAEIAAVQKELQQETLHQKTLYRKMFSEESESPRKSAASKRTVPSKKTESSDRPAVSQKLKSSLHSFTESWKKKAKFVVPVGVAIVAALAGLTYKALVLDE